MTTLIILAQTQTGAIVMIVALLLVAVIIGYLTAYLYYKSVYTEKINILNEEIAKLKGQLTLSNDEINMLGESLKEKEKEIEDLKKKK